MTGFARVEGGEGPIHWALEAKSVNGKSLELRVRLPPGFEWLESLLRQAAQMALTRGNVLFVLSLGVTIGFLASGWLADRFGLARVVSVSASLFIAAQVALTFNLAIGVVMVVYLAFGLSGGFLIVLLAQPRLIFPLAITGQATTATNLFAIGGTFLIQWWFGLVVDLFPADGAGHYPPQAYAAALGLTAGGMLLALLWYLPMLRESTTRA